jgi:hypothetical protein
MKIKNVKEYTCKNLRRVGEYLDMIDIDIKCKIIKLCKAIYYTVLRRIPVVLFTYISRAILSLCTLVVSVS